MNPHNVNLIGLTLLIESRFKILAHIIPAQSRATGAMEGVGGEFDKQVNLLDAPYLYGPGRYSYSAEFLASFSERREFYDEILYTFDLDSYLLPTTK